MIKHIAVKYSKLRQISAGRNLSVKYRKEQAVTIVQCRINRIIFASGKIHAKKSVKVNLGSMSFPIAYIPGFNLIDI